MAGGMNARPICSVVLFYALLILAFVVSKAAARPVVNAPPCAVSCLETVARASGCMDPREEACVCSIHDAILQESKSCIDRTCVDQEKVDALEYLNYFCTSEAKPQPAVNTTLPSSVPTLPPSADPLPTSASTAPSIHESSTPTLSSTTPSSLPGWSAARSPTVIADRAAESTGGGKHDDDDDDDDDKKESKTHKVGKIIGGVIGGIGGGIAAIMGVQSMLSGGGSGIPCCCCCGCCGCGTML